MPLNQTKPTETPRWATSVNPAHIATPPTLKKDAGWIIEKPPVQYMNYLFRYIWEWISYYQTLTDIGLQEYDAVVKAVGGTDVSLSDAITRVSAGAKVLVLEDQTVNTSAIVVNKAIEIVLKPGVSILKGTSAQGLSVTASGVRIKGGKITGFNGVGDKGIAVDIAATKVMIGEIAFSTNETDIDDPSGTAAVYGCVFS